MSQQGIVHDLGLETQKKGISVDYGQAFTKYLIYYQHSTFHLLYKRQRTLTYTPTSDLIIQLYCYLMFISSKPVISQAYQPCSDNIFLVASWYGNCLSYFKFVNFSMLPVSYQEITTKLVTLRCFEHGSNMLTCQPPAQIQHFWSQQLMGSYGSIFLQK